MMKTEKDRKKELPGVKVITFFFLFTLQATEKQKLKRNLGNKNENGMCIIFRAR